MAHSVEPKVELLAHTGGELIAALGAKLCYSDATIQDLLDTLKPQMDECNQGADTKREADKFLSMISQMGHHSVFEHVSFSFGIEGGLSGVDTPVGSTSPSELFPKVPAVCGAWRWV